jgi:CubicO group peptidase (beta-lactamase class C family)
MKRRAAGLLAGILVASFALGGAASAQEQPNEGQILLEEIPHIAQRTTMYSLPPDPDAALEAPTTYFPHGADAVIGMHLGRLHPTPSESTPGVAPLPSLLAARAGLLTDPQHLEKKARDTANGEVAILLLPIDATTAIVILPTEVVKADPKATPLPERRVDLSDVTYEINGETRTIEQYMADGATNAIGFVHDGEFVYDDYQNGFRPETRHQFWSATKSVTTALVGIAMEDGLLDSIDDPIEKYLPETVGTAWEGTTLEDILRMQSGIYWVDVPIHQPEQLVLMGFDFHTGGLYGMTRNEYLLRLTRVSDAGTHHRYNSADTQMLAWLLERVYGDDYATILSEKLWQPAGMESDALVMTDRVGDTFASMGLFATVKDAARFGELFRNGGRNVHGEQIVPEAWVEASTDYSEETGGPRGYQWMRWSEGYTAQGFGTQRIQVAPALDMVGVRFGNDPADSIAPKEFEALYLAVAEELGAGTDPADPNDPADPSDPGDPGDPGGPGDVDEPGDGDGKGKGDGSGGGRDDAPGQQDRPAPPGQQSLRGELASSVTDGGPSSDVLPLVLVLGLMLTAATLLTRGRSSQR